MICRKVYLILLCVSFFVFSITSCTSEKDRKTEKYIKSSLISKIHEYPYNEYNTYVYDELKSSKVNDSIRFYILNFHHTDIYGVKRLSFTYGYFNMNTGCDVSDIEDKLDDNKNRFINTEIY